MPILLDLIAAILKPVGGAAFVAAKRFYFGVGGSTVEFLRLIKERHITIQLTSESIGTDCADKANESKVTEKKSGGDGDGDAGDTKSERGDDDVKNDGTADDSNTAGTNTKVTEMVLEGSVVKVYEDRSSNIREIIKLAFKPVE